MIIFQHSGSSQSETHSSGLRYTVHNMSRVFAVFLVAMGLSTTTGSLPECQTSSVAGVCETASSRVAVNEDASFLQAQAGTMVRQCLASCRRQVQRGRRTWAQQCVVVVVTQSAHVEH